MKPRVAIVCDWLASRGGAERVIAAIAELYPEAPIYTSVYDQENLPEFAKREVITSFLQKLPFAKKKYAYLLPLMPYAFEQFDLSAYDIVISSNHSCSKGIITKPQTLHICYCHSPMRYAWDSCHEYFAQYGIPKLLQGRAKHMLHQLRQWDFLAAQRVDSFIANSEHVTKRIEKYYRRDAHVIYPPVDTETFFPLETPDSQSGRYFLAVGRLTPYKRFDLLIDVFNELKLPLVIVGTGKEEQTLQKRAGRFITFLSKLSDETLRETYQHARALVFPQVEDFGITPLEAMSCGKPVIAFGSGGALETVIPGKTGLFFMEQTVDSLKKSVLEFEAMNWKSEDIREHAEKFGKDVFQKKFHAYIGEEWGKWQRTMV